jgi:hypothetical protein
MSAAGRRIEANPIANSYVLDARADLGNDSGAIGAKNMRHCYAHASDAEPIPNIYMIERRGAELHDGLTRAVESRLLGILEKQLVDAAMPVHPNSFQSASCCENYSLARAIFEVNVAISGRWGELRGLQSFLTAATLSRGHEACR